MNTTTTATNRPERIMVPVGDIYESTNDYTLKLEMPGVGRDGLDITIHDDELEIKGTVEALEPEGKSRVHAEFNLYNYYRKFRVGTDIDRNKIQARLENGVLTLVLEKQEQVKPRRIEIQVQ